MSLTREELREVTVIVWQRFPRIPTERNCKTERDMRDRARNAYKERLINDITAKKNLLAQMASDAEGARG